MPDTATRRFQCRHIFTDGHRCGSPCLRDEDFCFYHSARRARPIPTLDHSQGEHRNSAFTLPPLEDRSAIQHAIGDILNKLASNEVDVRRAGLLLYGLQIASLNLPQPKPAPARAQESPIEEIVADPVLGPIAPRSELSSPDAPASQPTSLVGLLLQELQRKPAEPAAATPTQPIPPPDPELAALIPSLHAAAPPAAAPGQPPTAASPVRLAAPSFAAPPRRLCHQPANRPARLTPSPTPSYTSPTRTTHPGGSPCSSARCSLFCSPPSPRPTGTHKRKGSATNPPLPRRPAAPPSCSSPSAR